jgi:hypothetical protein
MNQCTAPRLLRPYHPRQVTRARNYARALAAVALRLDMLSDQIYRYLMAAGDEMAAKHVRREFQDQGRELDDFLRPKFLAGIDGWACVTPPAELARMGVRVPDAPGPRLK